MLNLWVNQKKKETVPCAMGRKERSHGFGMCTLTKQHRGHGKSVDILKKVCRCWKHLEAEFSYTRDDYMIYYIDVYYNILCIDVVSAALPNLTSHVVLLVLWQVDSCMKQLLELQQQKDVLPRLVAAGRLHLFFYISEWLCKKNTRKATRNVSLWVS